MIEPCILLFDSGIGGLTVFREIRALMPYKRFVYIADDAGFPYGTQEEEKLNDHILSLMGDVLKLFSAEIVVLSCNTASTLSLENLRSSYPSVSFVGTVPAVKPAAERTCSGLISVLGTPVTTGGSYTRDLIEKWAEKYEVILVGSNHLARIAELYVQYGILDESVLKEEIAPCFIQKGDRQTDVVVLACTHYPFLLNHMQRLSPWHVDWLDTGRAIARRVFSLSSSSLESADFAGKNNSLKHIALFTSGSPDSSVVGLMENEGFIVQNKFVVSKTKGKSKKSHFLQNRVAL